MSTVTIPVSFDSDLTTDALAVAYVAADVSTKAAIRAAHKAAVFAAAMAGDGALAQHLVTLEPAMAPAKSTGPTVDYVARVRDLRATLVAAVAAIDAHDITFPDGVTVDLPADLSGGTVDTKRVSTLATVAGRKAGRGAVAPWIDSVLGDDPTTIADLRAAWTATDDYPTEPPSAGAIAACLDRDGAAEFGIEVCDVNGKKGAVRS